MSNQELQQGETYKEDDTGYDLIEEPWLLHWKFLLTESVMIYVISHNNFAEIASSLTFMVGANRLYVSAINPTIWVWSSEAKKNGCRGNQHLSEKVRMR